jgi:hypothetical protein
MVLPRRSGYGVSAMRWQAGLLVLPILLGGCTQYYWTKPGMTPAEFQIDKGGCVGKAYSEVPAAPTVAPLGPGYISPRYVACAGAGYPASCYLAGGQYWAPAQVPYDANGRARNEVYKACMYKLGWRLVRK